MHQFQDSLGQKSMKSLWQSPFNEKSSKYVKNGEKLSQVSLL